MNRQYVIDQINVWSFHPSSDIEQIENKSGIGGKGTFYLYASRPEVDNSDEFNLHCERREAKSAILGCYNNKNIYVYSVKNPKLYGIEEVSAAHEMLHAAWDRMSDSERASVGVLLEAQYATMTDKSLKERMDYYERTEPGEKLNELHSIIGSEVAQVSPKLESYYAQYFTDRSKVTSLYKSYNSVFTQLANESDALYAQLGALGTEIDTLKQVYQIAVSKLSGDIATFNQRANDGDFKSNADFNQQRAAIVARSNALESQRVIINDKVQQYNDDNARYQALVVQSEALNKSIDSSVAPAPSL